MSAAMDVRAWRLDLPFAAPPMRDNDRPHWAAKHRVTAELRATANWLAKAAKLPKGLGRVEIRLCWQPATSRRRDQLSIAPTLKPLVDGLVDYGLVADDDTEHVELRCDVGTAYRGVAAGCWLEITEIRGNR